MERMIRALPFGVVGTLTIMMTPPTSANAGEPPTAERFYYAGYRDGQDNPFNVTTFQECDTESKFVSSQNQYEDGFLDGCTSVVCKRRVLDRNRIIVLTDIHQATRPKFNASSLLFKIHSWSDILFLNMTAGRLKFEGKYLIITQKPFFWI